MKLKKIVSLSILLFITLAVNAQTASQIIANYVKFTGGEKRWKTVKSIVTSGKYNYGGIEFPFTSYSKAPNLYKFIVPFKGKYYAQSFDGTQGWKIDAFKNETKPTFLTGKPARALANEADVELESPFINYVKKGHKALLEGKDTIQTHVCFKIKFTRKNDEVETYFFDSKTFELILKKAISKNAEMENGLLATFYSDYRTINGFKIPFKATSKLQEQTMLTITLEKWEINVPIADSEFQP